MANPAHKRADGRAAKSPSGRAITDHADCCDCGGGGGPGDGDSACYDGCVTIAHSDVTCGVPDGQTPSFPTWIITVAGSVTYEDNVVWRNAVGIETVVSDVRRQTKQFNRRLDVPQRFGRPQCSSPISSPTGDPEYTFTQSAPPSSRRYSAPVLGFSEIASLASVRSGTLLWNVASGDQSRWQSQGPFFANGTNENTLSLVGATPGTRYGIIVAGIGNFNAPVGFSTDIAGRWTPTLHTEFCQTRLAGTVSAAELSSFYYGSSSGSAEASITSFRTGCSYLLRHTGSGGFQGVRPDSDRYTTSVQYSFDYTMTISLGRCRTNGLRGPGGSMVDPAVDALVRGYGGCKGCGDGNPMA